MNRGNISWETMENITYIYINSGLRTRLRENPPASKVLDRDTTGIFWCISCRRGSSLDHAHGYMDAEAKTQGPASTSHRRDWPQPASKR
jgi:hypothetical protein